MTPRAKTLTRLEAVFATVALCALQACGARSVDLNHAGIETSSSASTGGAIVLPDEVTAIWADESRLYWTTVESPVTSSKFESCLKSDCARTITTYSSQQAIDVAIAGGHVYWNVINNDETIFSCPSTGCDGPPTRVVQDPTLGSISADGDYVYWASGLDIYRCLYTGCAATPEVVATQESPKVKLAFQGSDAFWSDDVASIRRVPKDGSRLPTTFTATQTFSIATDAASLYWIENDYADTVHSCPLTGCDANGGSALLATSPGRDDQLAVNASGVYWLDIDSAVGQPAVHSCPLAGCGTGIQTLTSPGVIGFAVDDSYVYWIEMDPHLSYAGNIHRTPT